MLLFRRSSTRSPIVPAHPPEPLPTLQNMADDVLASASPKPATADHEEADQSALAVTVGAATPVPALRTARYAKLRDIRPGVGSNLVLNVVSRPDAAGQLLVAGDETGVIHVDLKPINGTQGESQLASPVTLCVC